MGVAGLLLLTGGALVAIGGSENAGVPVLLSGLALTIGGTVQAHRTRAPLERAVWLYNQTLTPAGGATVP